MNARAEVMGALADSMAEAAIILVRELSILKANTVLVCGTGSGVGVSTVASGLAQQVHALHGLRVLLVDLTMAAREGTEPVPPLGKQFVSQPGGWDRIQPMMGADERRAAVLGRVLEEYGAQYDFVLVESPPVLESADTLIAASLVPRAVIVAEAGQTRYEVVERVRRDLERAGATILCGVLNKHQRSIPAWVYRWLIQ